MSILLELRRSLASFSAGKRPAATNSQLAEAGTTADRNRLFKDKKVATLLGKTQTAQLPNDHLDTFAQAGKSAILLLVIPALATLASPLRNRRCQRSRLPDRIKLPARELVELREIGGELDRCMAVLGLTLGRKLFPDCTYFIQQSRELNIKYTQTIDNSTYLVSFVAWVWRT